MAEPLPELRILIVADDPLARAGLAAMLEGLGVEIVGQIAEDADLVEQVPIYRPNAVVMDLGWGFGAEATSHLDQLTELGELGMPAVVLLPQDVDAGQAWDAGARCILLRDATAAQVTAALQAAMQGLIVLDGDMMPGIVSAREGNAIGLIEDLTPRETEVLQLLADGLTNKAIAHELGISEHTVKFHVNAILGKLQAGSRTEAVVRAARLGLLML